LTQAQEGAIKIAIIGDSITEGYQRKFNGDPWPEQLANFFGDNKNIDVVDLSKSMTRITEPKERQNYYSPLFHNDVDIWKSKYSGATQFKKMPLFDILIKI
jgi:hypothetical protein